MQADPSFDLRLILSGGLVENNKLRVFIHNKYKSTDIILADYDGTLQSMARSTATISSGTCDAIERFNPHVCIAIADRFEVLPFAMAVAYAKVPLIHIQAFERSGNIDDRVRDAVSSLADVHLVSHRHAAMRGYDMGHRDIYVTGCPSTDRCRQFLGAPKGNHILFMYHPVTTDIDGSVKEMMVALGHVRGYCIENSIDLYIFAPNNDPGYKKIRESFIFRTQREKFFENLPGKQFYRLLSQAIMIVGNSSAGLREASYLGVKAINVGLRQLHRICSNNVIACTADQVALAMEEQMEVAPSELFGNGRAVGEIITVLKRYTWERKPKEKTN